MIGAPTRSALEDRPADLVPQPLVLEYEVADRLRKLVTLPPALQSPCVVALAFGCGSACGLDRIGGRSELMGGDVRDDRGLAGGVRGMPRCPTQLSGRGLCTTGRLAGLGHLDLAMRPAASMLDRLTRSRVLRPSRLEEVEDMCCAGCRPQREELMVCIGERPAAADRHEARVADVREDHALTPITRAPACRLAPVSAVKGPAPQCASSGRRSPRRMALRSETRRCPTRSAPAGARASAVYAAP